MYVDEDTVKKNITNMRRPTHQENLVVSGIHTRKMINILEIYWDELDRPPEGR